VNLDVTSKTDPLVKVYIREKKEPLPEWQISGQTETMKDNLNPDFTKNFTLNYYFQKQQQLKFEVLNEDDGGAMELVGMVETTFAKIMASPK